MNSPDETAARMTLKLAGEFQQIRDLWVRRLNDYFDQLESLVDGQWLDTTDLKGVIRESQQAAREAIDGLGGDLSAVLVHESGGLFARFESERRSLIEEIFNLRAELAQALSGDEKAIRRENQELRAALSQVPEFKLLRIIQEERRISYKELAKIYGKRPNAVRKLVKALEKMGYVAVDKKARPHRVLFLSSPWRSLNPNDLEHTSGVITPLQDAQVEHH